MKCSRIKPEKPDSILCCRKYTIGNFRAYVGFISKLFEFYEGITKFMLYGTFHNLLSNSDLLSDGSSVYLSSNFVEIKPHRKRTNPYNVFRALLQSATNSIHVIFS